MSCCATIMVAQQSPNGKLTVHPQNHTLTVHFQNQPVLDIETVTEVSALRQCTATPIKADYQMLSGKKNHCTNEANEYRCGALTLCVYNDGIALRYDNANPNANFNVNDNVNDNAHRSTLHAQPSTLYVYDALTGESTEVGEDGTVTIQPNDYGRYFLTSTEVSSPLERQNEVSIIVSVRGSQVTVTATDDLQQVRAVSVSGATMYQAADCGTNCQFQLQPGTYIIDAESADGRKTVKVFVR